MLTITLALLLAVVGDGNAETCSDYEQPSSSHLSDVCSEWLSGDVAYSVTMRASMNPQPASQQVMVYRMGGEWFVRAAGYRWTPGTSEVTTRRNDLPISEEDSRMIETRLSQAELVRLAQQPYYGSDDVICTDGANIELATAANGQRYSARQHSCAGETELTEISALFREIAIKYDSEFDGYLNGL